MTYQEIISRFIQEPCGNLERQTRQTSNILRSFANGIVQNDGVLVRCGTVFEETPFAPCGHCLGPRQCKRYARCFYAE